MASSLLSIWRHPVLRASLTSGAVMACGDVLCQAIRTKGSGKQLKIDTRQTARFALIGVTLHGPLFFNGFRWLDATVGPAATLPKALLKTCIGQVTLFPVYTVSFFAYMGMLEGLTSRQCEAKIRQSLPPALVTGSVFWPAVNVLNFMFVPPAGRMLYVNAMGLFWNAFLSWANTTYGTGWRGAPSAVKDKRLGSSK